MATKTQIHPPTRNIIFLCFAALMLSACSGSDKIDLSGNKNVKDAIDAATGPLEDLNIKKREIPEPLKIAAQNPYARPAVMRCATLREEIAQLDEILGEDMQPKEVELASADSGFLGMTGLSDVKMPTTDQIEEKAGSLVRGKVLGLISDRVNIIPFRSIVRTVTGANRYQKKVTEAYEAGKLRRAYLKGLTQERFGKRCLALAEAPLPAVNEEAKAEETVTTDEKPAE